MDCDTSSAPDARRSDVPRMVDVRHCDHVRYTDKHGTRTIVEARLIGSIIDVAKAMKG